MDELEQRKDAGGLSSEATQRLQDLGDELATLDAELELNAVRIAEESQRIRRHKSSAGVVAVETHRGSSSSSSRSAVGHAEASRFSDASELNSARWSSGGGSNGSNGMQSSLTPGRGGGRSLGYSNNSRLSGAANRGGPTAPSNATAAGALVVAAAQEESGEGVCDDAGAEDIADGINALLDAVLGHSISMSEAATGANRLNGTTGRKGDGAGGTNGGEGEDDEKSSDRTVGVADSPGTTADNGNAVEVSRELAAYLARQLVEAKCR